MQIGEYEIGFSGSGGLWIEQNDGEGMQTHEQDFFKWLLLYPSAREINGDTPFGEIIEQFYKDNF